MKKQIENKFEEINENKQIKHNNSARIHENTTALISTIRN